MNERVIDLREQQRRDLAGRVVRALRFEWARKSLTRSPETGEYPIIVAFEDDRLADVLTRGESYGSVYNVIVSTQAHLWPVTFEALGDCPDGGSYWDVQDDVNMGMLLSMLRTEAPVTCRVRSNHGAVEVHDHPDPMLIPA